ncbi:PREDICTED: tRNA (guanine(10)-N2)-methyltransferase homolog isoform X1 [Drosophila arizonae]|uniref:tRNA (guanine(10)-N(2))-methyltransferase TRMT11 n=1 Tax=Drosophila arizonae TaxID=7263 RepID=A0ABM1PJZ1_DROAR|nr:PREDICTED: tRNA (guanine(10)-N2)-methyltransferase homolog isoform X1 [Drosophila arizonae]
MTKLWKKYILWFAQEHVDFRVAEFESIVKLFGLQFRNLSEHRQKPFWLVEFPNDETAHQYASRSIALRSIIELYSHAHTFPEFHKQLQNHVHLHQGALKEFFKANSFKVTVETYNKHFSQREKVEKIETMDYLPIEGAVNLKNPQVEWWYLEFWGLDPTAVPAEPEDILFGRMLVHGQRHLIKQLSLKQRKFIGNTSMDAQLSLLMANQALVRDGDLVFDPFVGTGSLLVSAAKFGGYVLGADIDFMMVHARCRPSRITQKVRDKDESIRANLQQYGCANRYMDVLVADFSNPLWHRRITFDSIITDPPYGIREATEKVETKVNPKDNTRTADMAHYPSTSHYALHHLYADLLEFGATHLKLGGRLVCWLPFHREDYNETIIPQHTHLRLVANSEQPLAGNTARRLLTYEKHMEYIKEEKLNENSNDTQLTTAVSQNFRERYFNTNGEIESRQERRMRKAALREQGRLEMEMRGKLPSDGRAKKCDLNKARFN